MKGLIIRVLIISIPTYTVAFITEKMVFTIPMLAITTIIATSVIRIEEETEIEGD